uniref:Uncharacterized protein n=1 Tax=viral metagenome TaxID=1070528 RepID=A0A6C0DKY0_9ZZZZ
MSILDKAMAMQREQEKYIGGQDRVNAEQSRAKGSNKKKQFLETVNDDDEFEVANSAYSASSEQELNSKGRDKIFSSKSKEFEAVTASKEDLERYGIKKGMKAEDIAKMRNQFN